MIFEEYSPGKVIVDQELLLEWKEKAKKYDDWQEAQKPKPIKNKEAK